MLPGYAIVVILVWLTYLEEAACNGLVKMRFEIHDGPDTDTFTKPDMDVEIILGVCKMKTSYVDGSYSPSLPEIFFYKYHKQAEPVEFNIYENEAISASWKLGEVPSFTLHFTTDTHIIKDVYKPGGKEKLKNKQGTQTTLHIFLYDDQHKTPQDDPKLKAYKSEESKTFTAEYWMERT
ncbi:uncharacterized protein LOC110860180 [Folsomia candida]|uniref:Uncharacterized protein n=1 Tax=Folsomia candida TaxID=158441 RepID=A0A226D9E5_FOLCA|nr:uncharacterized protein LOC110860180 [Folsomia candida]OXA41367.1 hypothetical protein Fcan01_23872 [Folsomia candida]